MDGGAASCERAPAEVPDATSPSSSPETFFRIILPLSKPALAVVALFHFLFAWNDFMGPLLYLTEESTYTLSLGLQAFRSAQGGTDWPSLMAASTLICVPVIVLFVFTQKTFIKGIATTGLKG